MATIKPFRATHPNPCFADQLMFSKAQAESVGDLKALLETAARIRPEAFLGQQQAYLQINSTLKYLLESERLWLDKMPAIYVYEVEHPTYTQTGIWTLTSLNDEIKTHELTFDDSVRRIKNYRKNTGLEGSPILITYKPEKVIDEVILERRLSYPDARYQSSTGVHKLWKIDNLETLNTLVVAFAKIDQIYLADGHHRLASAKELLPGFGDISALYMSSKELIIRPYNRVVAPELKVDTAWLFKQLLPHFFMHESFNNRPVQPQEERRMGLFIEGMWYNLVAKPNTYLAEKSGDRLDVSILQEKILAPLFEIADPGNDKRLKHIGGENAIPEMEALFKASPNAIGFTLCPMKTCQLMEAADEGVNLPPKSTWIEPKVPFGLLLYQHQ